MTYLNLSKTPTIYSKIAQSQSRIKFHQQMKCPISTFLPHALEVQGQYMPTSDLGQLKSVTATTLATTRHFATSNAPTSYVYGAKEAGMVQFQFLWRLMGLGDMTPPPLSPKEISVVPLKELLSYTKEGGAAPTSMDEMDTYNQTINDLLAHCDLTHYLTHFPNDSSTNSQYSRLDNILVGKTSLNHYWLLNIVLSHKRSLM